MISDLKRKVPQSDAVLNQLLSLCERFHTQEKTLYSLHEQDLTYISKGEAQKRYEFVQKVFVTTTNRGNWIVGVNLCEANPYDGHTLAKASQL